MSRKEPEAVKVWLAKYNGVHRLPPSVTGVCAYNFADMRTLLIATVPTTVSDARGRLLKSDGTPGKEEERIVLFGGSVGIERSIKGVNGGYNRMAKVVVDLLRQAKKISEDDYAAWSLWYDDHVDKVQAQAQVQELHRLAEAHGFTVTKKKPSARRPR